MVDVEMAVEAHVDDKRMRHGDAFGAHGVLLGVDELSEVLVVEVGHFSLALQLHIKIQYFPSRARL